MTELIDIIAYLRPYNTRTEERHHTRWQHILMTSKYSFDIQQRYIKIRNSKTCFIPIYLMTSDQLECLISIIE